MDCFRETTRKRWGSRWVLALAALMAAMVSACSDGNPPVEETDGAVEIDGGSSTPDAGRDGGTLRTLTSIEVSPTNPTLVFGMTLPLHATGVYSNGTTDDITAIVEWSSANEGIVTVDSDGLVAPVAAGEVVVTAALGGVSGTTTVTVSPATLTTVEVSPATATLAAGLAQVFTAAGVFSDGTTSDISASVEWSSSNESVAVSAALDTEPGRFEALAAGSATVTATLLGVSGTADLTVTNADLVSIALEPLDATIGAGTTQAFHAVGTFSDASTRDITTDVTWTSSVTSIATIDAAGVATGLQPGATTIRAELDSVFAETTLTISSAFVTALAITPDTASLPVGRATNLVATATLSDTSTQNVTSSVVWSSSDDTVATVSNVAGTEGRVTAQGTGSATITATLDGTTATATITVTSAVLESLDVTPATATVPVGTTVTLAATGHYSDGSTMDVTDAVTWSSSSDTTATVSNASASHGLVTGVGAGTATITASLDGVTATASVDVTAAVLVGIDVTPAAETLPVGLTRDFVATGHYSDATTADVTELATWSSSNTAAATVSNVAGHRGRASALAVGSSSITATVDSISGAATLTVTAATVTSIAISPTAPSVANGLTATFTATATLTDGSTEDVTAMVTWSSSATSVATISNAAGTNGVATSHAVGTTTIGAALSGVSSSTTLTVTAATLSSIAVSPATATVPRGTTQAFTATGTFSDGSSADVTASATWSTSDALVASVSNAAGSEGVLTGVAVGSATVTATIGARSGSASVTVTAATLSSIAVSPTSASVAAGLTQAFTATGTYSDATTADLTASVMWTTGDATVASISNAAGSEGVATGLATGSTSITATLGSVAGAASITVTAPVLTGITVAPSSASIARGTTQPFSATGTFSDGSSSDVSASVTWGTGSSAIATITSAGVATGTGVGTTTVTATIGSVTGTASLDVTAASLVSIAVTPSAPSITAGSTEQFTATGTYSDASTADLTTSVTWSSSNTSALTIDTSTGLATAVAAGTSTVTATLGSIAGTASATVTAPALTISAITPADGATSIAETTTIAVTFSAAMNGTTLTAQTTSGACTGAIQVSRNDFASCIAMAASTATLSGSNTIATVTPAAALDLGATYKVRVTTAATSAGGSSLASTQTQSTGFTVATATCGTSVVISQVFGGGGGSATVPNADYVVLHNRGASAVSLVGYTLQYSSATGSSWGSNILTLTGSIAPGGYFLVRTNSTSSTGTSLSADWSPSTAGVNMSASNGKIALVSSTTALTAVACPTDSTIVDMVGFGTATCPTAVVGALSSSTAAIRADTCVDTDNNTADFTIGAPAPQNSATAAYLCSCTANETGAAYEVDYCNIQFPTSVSVAAGATTPTIYTQVYESGVTEAAGAGTGVVCQIGYGATTVNPETQSGYTYVSTTFNTEVGSNDEFQASFTAPAAGSYNYVARCSVDSGTHWTYCDLDGAGSNAGLDFSMSQLAPLTVTP